MRQDLIKGVRALIIIRVVVVTILLGSFYLYMIDYEQFLQPALYSYFIACLYLLTIIYALVLRWIKTQRQAGMFAYTQIFLDIIVETILIYLTGGIGSMFSFMFLLSILSAGIVLSRRACYIAATISSICYGLLLNLQLMGIIEPFDTAVYTEKDYIYNIFAHIISFYLVGYLSGHLSEKLHRVTRSLEERDTVLSDLKAFSRYIIESIPSGIFTTDLDGKIISFNAAAQEITRQSHAAVIGKTPVEIFPFLAALRGPAERVEGEIQRDGQIFPVGLRLSSLKDSAGKSIGQIGVFQDLTHLKAMEADVKRKEKLAFIGELSASIAHELRNPLASLKASVEMLREKKVSEEHADRLMSIALSEMDRLNGIITDFLLYARPQKHHEESFDLSESLRDVVTLLQNSEGVNQNVTITANLEGNLQITGDAGQIRQVLWNLGLNAVDAVSEGGTVDISALKNGNSAEIIFHDTGTGISKDDMEKIFFPFFTTKEQGTGLGLSIAQKIIEEHGGQIIVDSDGRDRGTTFKIVLPV